jgi:type I site-specific restriction endonuclease
MKFWNNEIILIERLTVRDLLEFQSISDKMSKWEINQIQYITEFFKKWIVSINWETDKEKIANTILESDDLVAFQELSKQVTEKIQTLTWLKKKN